MDTRTNREYWEENAENWTKLARAGYDTYRDHLNTPAFLDMLPEVNGLWGLDLGCGEGSNTRMLVERGAKMTALDISAKFVRLAGDWNAHPSMEKIDFLIADAEVIPAYPESFDFVTGFMSFMDLPDPDSVIAETWRVLKPGGFLQFSISHPCMNTLHHKNLRDAHGQTYAFELGGYFDHAEGQLDEWIFSAAPEHVRKGMELFKVPRFTRTLSGWFNALLRTGFVLEAIAEPKPDGETVRQHPNLQDAQVMPYFLIIRVRKPERNPL